MGQEHQVKKPEKRRPSFASASELAHLTGISPPTVRLRCIGVETQKRVNGIEYNTRQALDAIFNRSDESNLDFEKERARSEKYRADLLEMDRAVRRKEFLPRSEVVRESTAIAANIRSKLLTLPASVALELSGLHSAEQIQAFLMRKVEGVLTELYLHGADEVKQAMQEQRESEVENRRGTSAGKRGAKGA
jgi:hypothetical protein